jgi:O-6-methylguanine DNA methyltransferase
MTSFQSIVYAAVKCIPAGETRSYQEVARAIGRSRAYRAVATALARNTDKAVPCHRVILASGKPGGYNGLREGSKAALIAKERAMASSSQPKAHIVE